MWPKVSKTSGRRRVHNVETQLKLFRGLLRASVTAIFEIFALVYVDEEKQTEYEDKTLP